MADVPHIIRIDRFFYLPQTTIGRMYINGEEFAFTLEDTVRAWGVKVQDNTAIPANSESNLYKVGVTHSNRFDREMPTIYNVSDGVLESGGIRFTGIRFHGGNSHLDTSGCPLVCSNWNNNEKIWGSLEKDLTAKIKELQETCDVYLLVTNLRQMG